MRSIISGITGIKINTCAIPARLNAIITIQRPFSGSPKMGEGPIIAVTTVYMTKAMTKSSFLGTCSQRYGERRHAIV